MEKDENKKKILQNIEIIVLSITIVILLVLCIYMIFIKKDDSDVDNNNISVNYSKIDETKEWIYVSEGNIYETNFGETKQISLDYPIINIDTQSVKKLNNLIKSQYENIESRYKELNNEDGCTCIKVNGSNRCSDHIETLQYVTETTPNYMQVLLYSFNNSECASGGSNLKSYIISTKTGEVLNNEEIIEYFEYDINKLLQKYNEFKKQEYSNIDEIFDNISDISKLSLLIHNDKLIIVDYGYIGDSYSTLLFDGNKLETFDDYDDPIKKWW